MAPSTAASSPGSGMRTRGMAWGMESSRAGAAGDGRSTPPAERIRPRGRMEERCGFAIDSVHGAFQRRQESISGVSEHTVISKIQTPQEQANPGPPHGFSAGEALVQPSLNRISIRGRVAQVEPKVMQVLLMMAERPGAVIARASFLDTVWAGTVGDDYLLNRAISELRRILDDDPQSPRYIETIRKGGYRLVAPVAPARVAAALAPAAAAQPDEAVASADADIDAGASAEAGDAQTAVGAEAEAATPSPAPPATAPAGSRRIPLAIAATLAVALALVAALTLWPATAPGPAAAYAVQPLTSFVGRELEPAISPDGSRVAFLWDDGGAFDVYVKAIGSAEVLNLSSSPVDERHPLGTPDGRALLFARSGGGGISIMRVSALGGTAIRVFHDPEMRQLRGMSLSPDGRHLVYAARDRSSGPYRLHLAGLEDGSRRALTDPGSGT